MDYLEKLFQEGFLENIKLPPDLFESNQNRPKVKHPRLDSGYDPALITNIVLMKIKANKVTLEHMQKIILFGHMRGSGGKKTWWTIYNTCSREGAKTLKEAVDYLSVSIGKPARNDVITVPRLMQAFPRMTWELHCSLILKNKRFISKGDYSGTLPLCLRYIGSPGVMGADVWSTYRKEYGVFAQMMGFFWRSVQSMEQVMRYAELSYSSNVLLESHRINMDQVKEMEEAIAIIINEEDEEKKEVEEGVGGD